MRIFFIFLFLFLNITWADRLSVFVSIAPQLEAVRQVGGNLVDASVILPSGASPETYSPSARELMKLSRADLVFFIGVPMEKGIGGKIKSSFPKLRVLDASAGMKLRQMDGERDPHVWLSLDNMVKFTDFVCEELCRMAPAQRAAFVQGAAQYKAKLEELKGRIAAKLGNGAGRRFLAFHPAYGYFADEFGLEQFAVEVDGKSAGPRHLAKLASMVEHGDFKTMIVPPQASRKQAAATADLLKLDYALVEPLPVNYCDGMLSIAESIAK